jgi:hypothetical protein
MSLLKDPITSFIFWIRSSVLMRDFAMTHISDSPHSKKRKELQSGELGGQTSSSYTSATVLLSVFPKALILYHGTSGAKPGDCPCSCAFLLIYLCRNVTVSFYFCFGRQLRRFAKKK